LKQKFVVSVRKRRKLVGLKKIEMFVSIVEKLTLMNG
jgi:hypothetical protein